MCFWFETFPDDVLSSESDDEDLEDIVVTGMESHLRNINESLDKFEKKTRISRQQASFCCCLEFPVCPAVRCCLFVHMLISCVCARAFGR